MRVHIQCRTWRSILTKSAMKTLDNNEVAAGLPKLLLTLGVLRETLLMQLGIGTMNVR